ncbi:MAG: cytosine deaminase [Leptolyngbyaceae cyanobacterium]
MYDLLLRQCRLLQADGTISNVDIAIQSGKIEAIFDCKASADSPPFSGNARLSLDIDHQLVSPPFVESHIHLDSALTAGQPRWNQSGTLFEGIEIWRDRKQALSLEDVKARALHTLKLQATLGVLFVRSHADASEATLTALQALLEVREQVKDWMTLQVVAFPQDGVYGQLQNEALLETALSMGADAVGGIPHYELTREDGVRSLHKIFELAQTYDRLIDIHCDEIDDEQSRFLEVVAACTIRSGMGARVTASHTTAFGSYNNAYATKLLSFLQRSGLNMVANPLVNITLQGRADTYPKRRGMTRVKELWQRGINVSFGHDDIQDPWYTLGTADMLDVAHMGLHVAQMTGLAEIDACYNMVTWNGAKTLHLEDQYGVKVGKPANLIVLNARDRYDAIRCRPTVLYVISRGKLLAQTEPPHTTWHGEKSWGYDMISLT